MDRVRDRKYMAVIAVVFVVLAGIWLATGGLRETSGQSPGRTAGQTGVPSTSAPAATDDTSPTTTQAEDTAGESPSTDPVSGLDWVALSSLPPEVADTVDAIESGPPYPYDRDGVTFQNREGLLPDEEYGYYQEFTVMTPGSSDRGARRVIWGLADELYYTDDHYESFARIGP